MQSYLQRRRVQQRVQRQHKADQGDYIQNSSRSHTRQHHAQRDSHEKSQRNDEQDGVNLVEKTTPSTPSSHDMQQDTSHDTAPQDHNSHVNSSSDELNKTQHNDDEFLVDWEDESDRDNPRNWSTAKRFGITLIIVSIRFVAGFASSIDSSARDVAAQEFGVAPVAESLSTANYLFGLASGALLAGPLSEHFGRNWVYIGTLLMSLIWFMASALAPNLAAQIVFRFLAGLSTAPPLVCAGGSISDLWDARERTVSFVLFATASYSGPVTGPLIGGWIVNNGSVDWRWTYWVTLIIAGAVTCLTILLLPETFAPLILRWKAEHLRKVTGDDRYKTEEEKDSKHKTTWDMLQTNLARPFLLVIRERIVLLFTIYLTIIYIVLYTFFGGYENIFGKTYGLSRGLIGTCFLGILIGLCLVWILVPIIWRIQGRDKYQTGDEDGPPFKPEVRLWFGMLGGAVAIPVSLYWMAWTAYPSISIASPLIASVFFGFGILSVWITAYQYIIDSYETYSASALAAMTAIRYFCAGGMTIVGVPFYNNLGVHYTLTILASLSALMVPIPYIFYIWGHEIRAKSKFATQV